MVAGRASAAARVPLVASRVPGSSCSPSASLLALTYVIVDTCCKFAFATACTPVDFLLALTYVAVGTFCEIAFTTVYTASCSPSPTLSSAPSASSPTSSTTPPSATSGFCRFAFTTVGTSVGFLLALTYVVVDTLCKFAFTTVYTSVGFFALTYVAVGTFCKIDHSFNDLAFFRSHPLRQRGLRRLRQGGLRGGPDGPRQLAPHSYQDMVHPIE